MNWESHHGPGLEWICGGPDGGDVPLIVWLHGFGASNRDLMPLCNLFDKRRHILPNGPLSDGRSYAWYERGGNEKAETVAETLQRFEDWFEQVLELYRPRRTAIIGFSQGGAMALRVGLPKPERINGVAVLAGSLRRVDDLTPTLPTARTQKVYVAHGRTDEVVPCDVARDLVAYLRQQGYTPHFQTYQVGHTISPRLAADLNTWLDKILG